MRCMRSLPLCLVLWCNAEMMPIKKASTKLLSNSQYKIVCAHLNVSFVRSMFKVITKAGLLFLDL
jgi:hypothetical protein